MLYIRYKQLDYGDPEAFLILRNNISHTIIRMIAQNNDKNTSCHENMKKSNYILIFTYKLKNLGTPKM